MQRKLPPDEQLLELSETMTCKQLAERYGVRPGTAYKVIRAARRRRDTPKTGPQLPRGKELLDLSMTLTNRELGERFDMTPSSVSMAISTARRELGVWTKRARNDRAYSLPPDDELVEMSLSMTQREIADQLGLSASYVGQKLKPLRQERGLPPMGRARRKPAPKTTLPPAYEGPPLDELNDALTRWGIDGVAEEYDVSTERVCAWMRALGI